MPRSKPPDPERQGDETPLQALDEIAVVEPAAFAGPAHGSLPLRREPVGQTREAMILLRDAMEGGAAALLSLQQVRTIHGVWMQACAFDREASGAAFMADALPDFATHELIDWPWQR
ncbi:hypothetical protein [Xylophilus sp. GOD-11R]|uniref:hypothetical protein n=1 Tax=Xylophilus sp. GOD-11R TaxID=3089814 RepID=UPI00298CE85D|nr:hypothetical protein [Xylophilus sp. GOD-11R]WPB59057.1 hypothetical protein R9X41_10605 [Xylophilus sp. GOD-11R]